VRLVFEHAHNQLNEKLIWMFQDFMHILYILMTYLNIVSSSHQHA